MMRFNRCVLVVLAFTCLALAACGGNALTPFSAQPAAAQTERLQLVRNAKGAVIDAGNGNAVQVAPRALGTDERVRVLRDESSVAAPPNPAWSMIAGTLDVKFEHAVRAPASLATAMHLTLGYPAARAQDVLHARMPLVVVTYANGRTGRFGFEGSFDTAHDRVGVDVPSAALNGAVDVRLGVAVDNPTYTLPPPGPRYWTGNAWSKTGKIDPTKRTLVFIHGIFSSVETAFPNPCTPEIMKAGGYQQAVGWDYNWTNPPQVEGPKFAAFVSSLKEQKLDSVDIEAHSYGSLVTYAAVPKITEKLKNVVTLGGPLPLRGTPLARGYLLRLVLVSLADIFVGPPSLIDHAYHSGMVKSMATNGPEVRAILAGIKGMPAKPDFVDVAGTKEYPEEAYLYPILYFYIDYPWDGIVEKVAANSADIPNSFPNHFDEEHTELECSGSVIAYVGSQVRPNAHAIGGKEPAPLRTR
jgi:pimeloyl-ACP methyl ester carboxylesterase